jgi:hypothetical protein
MAIDLEDAEAEWPLVEQDPERVAWLRAAGIRPATRSLDRPRHVARPRAAWLAFLLRVADAVAAAGRRLLGIQRKPSQDDLELDLQLSEIWPVPERDPEVAERMRAAGIRLATDSLDRPRRVAKPRPAWAAFLLTMLKVRS